MDGRDLGSGKSNHFDPKKPVGVGFTLPTQRRGSPISPPQQSAYGFNRSIMANYLAHFQTIKNACDRLVIAVCYLDLNHINRFSVEDVSDLWPAVKKGFEERLPFKRACLNNKTRNPVFVEKLAAEFILTTDPRLRSRFPQEQLLFWFREPYATVVLVSCEQPSLEAEFCT
ncbi:Trafficking protein particle complex II-specific subunit 130-like [Vitis vinifera]|uniref:Trafficking protein particle complex II-specific subunit 130-like n=1 Tax=Vitis vinifera TaxID=29760 RepID=A0A438DM00_VITVI|nr:Trafficking protein particle complex II-specific subunit 130-like [Vitis vinifera]